VLFLLRVVVVADSGYGFGCVRIWFGYVVLCCWFGSVLRVVLLVWIGTVVMFGFGSVLCVVLLGLDRFCVLCCWFGSVLCVVYVLFMYLKIPCS